MKAINTNPESLRSIFSQHQFVIPEFQRSYSWEKEQCEQLWDDIVDFCQDAESQQYFLGSIVVYKDDSGISTWCIVDGQQRLTTLMLLIKVLFDNAGTMEILQRFLHEVDPNTGNINYDKLRLESKVQAGANQNEAHDLRATILEDSEFVDPKNNFKKNYDVLTEMVEELWKKKTPEERKKFITKFLDEIVLLPVECDSIDDALDLFQIINDRGLQLSDADIFKARIYGPITSQEDKNSFVARWGDIEDHDSLFRLLMHISRAERNDTSKEISIRKYMIENILHNNGSLANNWDSVMRSLELCHWVNNEEVCNDTHVASNESIYWQILGSYPNTYWKYPVFVFLHKYMEGNIDNGFHLPNDKHVEYITLLRDTIRYFFIKGVVHNSINAVKDTTFKACAAIHADRGYPGIYHENSHNDIETFGRQLESCDYGRYRKGLIFLNSIPNKAENWDGYAVALRGKVNIEHILPRKWNDYDKWDEDSHARDIDKLGNLIPLEKKVNLAASNEFFKRKQKEYAKSNFPDAMKLSEKTPPTWYPEDVEKRHQEANKRLMEFFCEPFGS